MQRKHYPFKFTRVKIKKIFCIRLYICSAHLTFSLCGFISFENPLQHNISPKIARESVNNYLDIGLEINVLSTVIILMSLQITNRINMYFFCCLSP